MVGKHDFSCRPSGRNRERITPIFKCKHKAVRTNKSSVKVLISSHPCSGVLAQVTVPHLHFSKQWPQPGTKYSISRAMEDSSHSNHYTSLSIHFFLLFRSLFFETGSYYVTQSGFKLNNLSIVSWGLQIIGVGDLNSWELYVIVLNNSNTVTLVSLLPFLPPPPFPMAHTLKLIVSFSLWSSNIHICIYIYTNKGAHLISGRS